METITLQLPDETLQRYRRGAIAARKELEDYRSIVAFAETEKFLDTPVKY